MFERLQRRLDLTRLLPRPPLVPELPQLRVVVGVLGGRLPGRAAAFVECLAQTSLGNVGRHKLLLLTIYSFAGAQAESRRPDRSDSASPVTLFPPSRAPLERACAPARGRENPMMRHVARGAEAVTPAPFRLRQAAVAP